MGNAGFISSPVLTQPGSKSHIGAGWTLVPFLRDSLQEVVGLEVMRSMVTIFITLRCGVLAARKRGDTL